MTEPISDGRQPRSYSLVLPPGWTRLPVRDDVAEAVTALVDRISEGTPASGRRATVRPELTVLA